MLMVFKCLDQNDVISSKISDHHPLIHNDVLFWNIMMQGKKRINGEYNNGFGIEEDDADYKLRLKNITRVIAEIIFFNPNIEIIGLCEGPNKENHLKYFANELKKSRHMIKFFRNKSDFYMPKTNENMNWGVLMLASKKSNINAIESDYTKTFPALINRFQLWKLSDTKGEKYFALGHFPFRGDESIYDRNQFSSVGQDYCQFVNHLLTQYADKNFTLGADFNCNPHLISEPQDRVLDLVLNNSSQLLRVEKTGLQKTQQVTVDGILLSKREKQRCGSLLSHFGLFKREYRLSSAYLKKRINDDEEKTHLVPDNFWRFTTASFPRRRK